MSGMTPEEVAELQVVQAKVVMDIRLNALLKHCQIKAMNHVRRGEHGHEEWQPDQIRAEAYDEIATLLERIIEGKP